jgi:hypothetical protein
MSWHSQDAASKPERSRTCMVPLSCLTRRACCKAPIARVTPGRSTPKHGGHEFLSHEEAILFNAVKRRKKPTSEALLDGMPAIAGGLGNLG